MLTYNFYKNFLLPDRATRIRNLVAPMKFLVAWGKRAAVNVEPCDLYNVQTRYKVFFKCELLNTVELSFKSLNHDWKKREKNVCMNHD